ncbi:short-chain dehydrogenase [Marinobacter fuscus]|uniref:Short-chain dehydrogenase n=1 Tax=Marinobacter fuscus TaxID=2109942 RepID=A0A2T1KQ84_9GAMM|nr:SDR family oxidoreductase [Marinobacter fuscus]PSF12309.1 short-chain dehydrogenase [Marinobacter fuscus]
MTTLIAGVSGAIGSALAEQCLAQGEQAESVIGLCRNPEKIPDVLTQNDRFHALAWDAEDPEQLNVSALKQRLEDTGPVTTVIYAAGLLHDGEMFPEKRLEDLDRLSMSRAYTVNCLGFGLLIQALAPMLRGKQFKRLVAISAKVGSIEGNHLGGWYAYRCSKAALNMLVKNLSVELPRRFAPIACIALHPGTTFSALSEPFQQSLGRLNVHQPEQTADNLYRVIEGLSEKDNGRFFHWDGSALPW